MSVSHEEGTRLRVRAGHHELVTDLPVESGGHDSGPTPTELFVAALAACAAHQAQAYLAGHGLDTAGLEVGCHYELGSEPARVTAVQLTVSVPGELTEWQRTGLARAIDRCTVHASIAIPATLQVVLARREPAPAGAAS